jgi:uncharacterized protein (DUF1800 family)
MATIHPLLREYQPSDSDPFDRAKAAHLLNRAGFGGTEQEIAQVLKQGPRRAVESLLAFPDAPAAKQTPTDTPDLSSIQGDYPNNYRQRRILFRGKDELERKEINQMLQRRNREALDQMTAWWLKRMAYGPHPLQEKLTLFWHGHFTTSARDERQSNLMWQQNETLRQYAAGNFRQFLHAISRDPAMLDYLNNTQNRKQHANENYAREVMELFTLGLGHYTEQDIRQSARAFTGWTHDGESYVFQKSQHDEGTKTFLGHTGNFNGDDILEIILKQPACAPFVAGELYQYFTTEADLDPALAASLGDLFRNANFQLRPLIRTILCSQAFYSPQVMGAQIKSPVQLMIGTIRMLNLEMPPSRVVMGALNRMGQVPLAPPNVKGWPGGRTWINTSTLFVRYNSCLFLAGGSVPMVSQNYRQLAEQTGGSPQDAVDQWLARLIQRPVLPEKKKVLIQALDGQPGRPDNLKRMVQLIVSMPEYQLC